VSQDDNPHIKSFGETFTPQLAETLRNYSFADLRVDASAGLNVAVVSPPLAMALAVASDASPAAGLASAIVGGFVTSLLGGSRYQIGGPATAFVALLAKTVVLPHFLLQLVATQEVSVHGGLLVLLGRTSFV
jgi:sulfate permease, SulP family